MAVDLDNFPVYDPITKYDPDLLSDIWCDFLATFMQTLTGYLSQNGIFLPVLTTAQRDAIQTPQEGQVIYNSTTAAPQIYQGGMWRTFMT